MAWETPVEQVTGTLITATLWNNIQNNLAYLLNPNADVKIHKASGDYTTTSGTFAAVDTTNLRITLTTYGGHVTLGFACRIGNDNASGETHATILEDGANIGHATYGLARLTGLATAPVAWIGKRTPAAGSHTFDLALARQTAGTARIESDDVITLFAMEG